MYIHVIITIIHVHITYIHVHVLYIIIHINVPPDVRPRRWTLTEKVGDIARKVRSYTTQTQTQTTTRYICVHACMLMGVLRTCHVTIFVFRVGTCYVVGYMGTCHVILQDYHYLLCTCSYVGIIMSCDYYKIISTCYVATCVHCTWARICHVTIVI